MKYEDYKRLMELETQVASDYQNDMAIQLEKQNELLEKITTILKFALTEIIAGDDKMAENLIMLSKELDKIIFKLGNS